MWRPTWQSWICINRHPCASRGHCRWGYVEWAFAFWRYAIRMNLPTHHPRTAHRPTSRWVLYDIYIREIMIGCARLNKTAKSPPPFDEKMRPPKSGKFCKDRRIKSRAPN